jgi:hypothetical protein
MRNQLEYSTGYVPTAWCPQYSKPVQFHQKNNKSLHFQGQQVGMLICSIPVRLPPECNERPTGAIRDSKYVIIGSSFPIHYLSF